MLSKILENSLKYLFLQSFTDLLLIRGIFVLLVYSVLSFSFILDCF